MKVWRGRGSVSYGIFASGFEQSTAGVPREETQKIINCTVSGVGVGIRVRKMGLTSWATVNLLLTSRLCRTSTSTKAVHGGDGDGWTFGTNGEGPIFLVFGVSFPGLVLTYHLSMGCDKIPDQSNLGKERLIGAHSLKGKVITKGIGWREGSLRQLVTESVQSRSRGRWTPTPNLPSPLYPAWDPSPWNGITHSHGESL